MRWLQENLALKYFLEENLMLLGKVSQVDCLWIVIFLFEHTSEIIDLCGFWKKSQLEIIPLILKLSQPRHQSQQSKWALIIVSVLNSSVLQLGICYSLESHTLGSSTWCFSSPFFFVCVPKCEIVSILFMKAGISFLFKSRIKSIFLLALKIKDILFSSFLLHLTKLCFCLALLVEIPSLFELSMKVLTENIDGM